MRLLETRHGVSSRSATRGRVESRRRDSLNKFYIARPGWERTVSRLEPLVRDRLVQPRERVLVPRPARAGRGVLRPRARPEARVPRRAVRQGPRPRAAREDPEGPRVL